MSIRTIFVGYLIFSLFHFSFQFLNSSSSFSVYLFVFSYYFHFFFILLVYSCVHYYMYIGFSSVSILRAYECVSVFCVLSICLIFAHILFRWRCRWRISEHCFSLNVCKIMCIKFYNVKNNVRIFNKSSICSLFLFNMNIYVHIILP